VTFPTALLVAAGLIAAVVALVFVGMDRAAVKMIRPPLKPIRLKVGDLPFPSRSVSIPSGGQRLSGWVVEPRRDNGGPVLVLCHGWGSNHGTMSRLAEPLLGMGYPVLLFDVRQHGESGKAPYVTARHFRDDILAALQFARNLYSGRGPVLVGHSMGGSTGILAAARDPTLKGLISIGAPADLWGVWAYQLNLKGLPGSAIVRGLGFFLRRRAGEPWDALDPMKRASELRLPFVVMHGAEDESVLVDQAYLLARAAGVEPWVFPGWGHTDVLDSPELHRALGKVLKAIPG
jgi:putative redox protein